VCDQLVHCLEALPDRLAPQPAGGLADLESGGDGPGDVDDVAGDSVVPAESDPGFCETGENGRQALLGEDRAGAVFTFVDDRDGLAFAVQQRP
jgi:hypothetical protein